MKVIKSLTLLRKEGAVRTGGMRELSAAKRNEHPPCSSIPTPSISFHFTSVLYQKKAGYKSVWGSDPPRPGTVEQHTVKSISYHQGGSSRRAKGAQPFAIIELEVSCLQYPAVVAQCIMFYFRLFAVDSPVDSPVVVIVVAVRTRIHFCNLAPHVDKTNEVSTQWAPYPQNATASPFDLHHVCGTATADRSTAARSRQAFLGLSKNWGCCLRQSRSAS